MIIKNKKIVIRSAVIRPIAIIVLTLLLITLAAKSYNRLAPAENVPSEVKSVGTEAVKTNDNLFGEPDRLVIPKIGVDTNIVQVGLTEFGDMDAPQTDEESGWYKYGARPGNVGSAVIAGHLGASGNAVFRKLYQLVEGDTIFVTDNQGQKATFIVTGTRMYDKEAAPSEVFTSTSGAHLNLITCEGSWEAAQSTYSQRLVVFTDKLN